MSCIHFRSVDLDEARKHFDSDPVKQNLFSSSNKKTCNDFVVCLSVISLEKLLRGNSFAKSAAFEQTS